jgi:hypothetical protein
MMILEDELEMLWKEAAVAYFVALSQPLPGGNKENHENTQSD